MPPNVNPYDPRKNRQQQPGQQQQQPQQQAQPAAPVQSSLPAIQQPQQPQAAQAGQPQQTAQVEKKKPAAPVTYQQQAGAVADPRFSQALAQKLQQDVAAKQAALQQQQAEFQQKLTEAGSGVAGAPTRINEILGKVKAGTATDAELAEFQSLQQAQYQGPTGLDGAANIAALSQLAASPALLAQQYAGFAPGGVSAGDFQRAMAGLQKSPQLAAAQEAATGLAQQATSAEEVASQQAALLKGQTEAAKEAAETGSKAAMAEFTGQVTEQTKAEREAKESALNKLKEGLFLTGEVSKADIRKLGLNPDDPNVQNVLQSLEGIDISGIEAKGIKRTQNIQELNEKVKQIQNDIAAGNPVTEEEKKLASAFSEVSGLTRGLDEGTSNVLSYAKKEDLAKINALRRLRGERPLTEEDIGKQLGGITQETLAGLTGRLKQGAEYTDRGSIKDYQSKMLKESQFNNEIGKFYEDLSEDIVRATKKDPKAQDYNKYVDALEEKAKREKDTNPHAQYLYDRLQKMKGVFGWDKDKVRQLAKDQIKQVEKRKTEYKDKISDAAKQLRERSTTTRKVKLKD